MKSAATDLLVVQLRETATREPTASVAERFAAQGAAAILVIDIVPLVEVERTHGASVYENVASSVASFAAELAHEFAPAVDLVPWELDGRDHVALVFFRASTDARFYRDSLPRFADRLDQELPAQCRKALYPFAMTLPHLHVGWSVVHCNPGLQTLRQIEKGLAAALNDAALARANEQRHQRETLLELLFERRVQSVFEKIVDLGTMQVIGFEALARGPEGSSLERPEALFRIARENDLTYQLDCLCRRAALDGASGKIAADQRLFLNCLPSSIHDPIFSDDELVATLTAAGLHPGQVIFEISESEAIKDYAVFERLRSHFRSLGFQFALDDTGTGYSSLSALMELAPEYIKIDRSLIRTIDQDRARQALLRAFQEVGNQLGAKLIAEGVETRAELECVTALGVPLAQGWFFGKGRAL